MAAQPAGIPRSTMHTDATSLKLAPDASQENLAPDHIDQSTQNPTPSPFNFTPRPYQPLTSTSSNAQRLDVFPESQHRKGHSRSRSRQSNVALPAFSFNPGAANTSCAAFSTPPASPTEEFPNSPSANGRHRRTTSEYIGGTSVAGPGGIRSVSPSKRELAESAPSSPAKSGATSRGHRHRRSGAVSSGDLKILPSQDSQSTFSRSQNTSFGSSYSASQNTADHNTNNDRSDLAGVSSDSISNVSSPPKARVGFSDTLEFISRPLSTISSATESSFSTMRGHSKGGSVSSVASFGAGSPSGKALNSSLPVTLEEDSARSRPRSAGAEGDNLRRQSFPFSENEFSLHRRKSVGDFNDISGLEESEVSQRLKKGTTFGSWASALVNRQTRRPEEQTKCVSPSLAPTPFTEPTELQEPVELLDVPDLNENFDEDPTCTIETTGPVYSFSRPLSLNANLAIPTYTSQFTEDRSSPMIDIDAALFSATKSTTPQDAKAKGKSFSAARRSMHSSGGMSGFFGPGMHYHRRAESEPQLPSVEFNYSDSRYLHSSSAAHRGFKMEDVFEEEHEDEALDGVSLSKTDKQSLNSSHSDGGLGIGIQVVDVDDEHNAGSFTEAPAPQLRDQRESTRRPMDSHEQSFSFFPSTIPVEIVSDDADPEEAAERSSDSTLTPLDRSDEAQEQKGVDMLPLALPRPPFLTPSGSTESDWSTPQYGGSTFSTPRLDTMSSSSTEPRKYPSLTFSGETSLDCRQSVDGVPSLISSRSTITSAYQGPRTDSSTPSVTDLTQPAPRQESATSLGTTSSRRRKRSSVASLSRIMGGSFGAKSNLSVEYDSRSQTPHGTKDAKEQKDKGSSRLSRMFKFFKAKEQPSAN